MRPDRTLVTAILTLVLVALLMPWAVSA